MPSIKASQNKTVYTEIIRSHNMSNMMSNYTPQEKPLYEYHKMSEKMVVFQMVRGVLHAYNTYLIYLQDILG